MNKRSFNSALRISPSHNRIPKQNPFQIGYTEIFQPYKIEQSLRLTLDYKKEKRKQKKKMKDKSIDDNLLSARLEMKMAQFDKSKHRGRNNEPHQLYESDIEIENRLNNSTQFGFTKHFSVTKEDFDLKSMQTSTIRESKQFRVPRLKDTTYKSQFINPSIEISPRDQLKLKHIYQIYQNDLQIQKKWIKKKQLEFIQKANQTHINEFRKTKRGLKKNLQLSQASSTQIGFVLPQRKILSNARRSQEESINDSSSRQTTFRKRVKKLNAVLSQLANVEKNQDKIDQTTTHRNIFLDSTKQTNTKRFYSRDQLPQIVSSTKNIKQQQWKDFNQIIQNRQKRILSQLQLKKESLSRSQLIKQRNSPYLDRNLDSQMDFIETPEASTSYTRPIRFKRKSTKRYSNQLGQQQGENDERLYNTAFQSNLNFTSNLILANSKKKFLIKF